MTFLGSHNNLFPRRYALDCLILSISFCSFFFSSCSFFLSLCKVFLSSFSARTFSLNTAFFSLKILRRTLLFSLLTRLVILFCTRNSALVLSHTSSHVFIHPRCINILFLACIKTECFKPFFNQHAV